MSYLYNKKAFLLPHSANTMAAFHAKVDDSGTYKLTIHDCNQSIRFHGDLNTKEDAQEAFDKLDTLIVGVLSFQEFIYQNYIKKNKKRWVTPLIT